MVARSRPLIAFLDYPDVFEDFYPHYGVTQRAFATEWADSGNHAMVSVVQRAVGDVLWYEFSLAPELDEGRHERLGCRVKFVPSSWLHRLLWRGFYLPKAAWRWRRAYKLYAWVACYVALFSTAFFRSLRRERPDAFLVQEYSSGRYDVLLLIARWLGVPLIALHAGSSPDLYIGRQAKEWTIRRADWLVPSSQAELEMLAARYRADRTRMSIILTPIDTARYCPSDRAEACQEAGLDPSRRWLLFVGRLDDRIKRVGALIRAFAVASVDHPDVCLAIAGNGPDREWLEQEACELGDRVRFLGWKSGPAALAPLYNAAECLVLPSKSEGFPTVVGEAMACGTPVLASRVGGVPELVIEGQTGWMIEPEDDAALTRQLRWVIEHPQATRTMRPAARAMAENRVSPESIASSLRKAFRAVGVSHVS